MIVGAEPARVSGAEDLLAELGYEAVGFRDASAALSALRAAPARFDALLADRMLPDIDGTDLAHRVRSLRPELPILWAAPSRDGALREAKRPGIAVVHQPLRRSELAVNLARLLSQSPSRTDGAAPLNGWP